MREKLIEILSVPIYPHELADPTEVVADYLLDNDVVPVVRCKDCRFCRKHPTSDKVKLCANEQWNTEYYPFAHDDGFCCFGERRTDEQQ